MSEALVANVDNRVDDRQALAALALAAGRVRAELAQRIVGQSQVIDLLMISLFASGHSLLTGVPGLAKTLLVSTLAKVLELSFQRIQFTPDLMPADITGTEVLVENRGTGERSFRFLPGPVFAHIVLADEINRTPPKTQAALLQAMQENEVSVGGQTHVLPRPYLVFATQNPIEQEGTYPLPEAELDRFAFFIAVDYPSAEEEEAIVSRTTGAFEPNLSKIMGPAEIQAFQRLIRRVPAAPEVVRFAVRLVRASRPKDELAPDFIREYVAWGAGPRACQALILGGKVRAALAGRFAVNAEDVRFLAKPVLRHRIIPNFHAEVANVRSPDLVERLLESVPA